MAGATAARSLAEAGLTVRVFDKGRGVGGRMATRRNAAMQFDHGAQFLRAHGHAFARRVEDWTLRGVVSPWAGAGRSVGVPGMTAPVRDLLTGLSVASATTITRICRNGTEWHLVDASGAVHGPFGALGITFPAPQVAALLDESHVALHGLARVSYAPCWSLMVALDVAVMESLLEPREDPVGLIALDSSKPGRPAGGRRGGDAPAGWWRGPVGGPRGAGGGRGRCSGHRGGGAAQLPAPACGGRRHSDPGRRSASQHRVAAPLRGRASLALRAGRVGPRFALPVRSRDAARCRRRLVPRRADRGRT